MSSKSLLTFRNVKLLSAKIVITKHFSESCKVYHTWELNFKSSREFVWCQFQWPRGLKRRSCLLKLWGRIRPGAWMFVCCECCVLSGRGLCDELVIRPEESYRLLCVIVCGLETSTMRTPWSALGRSATGQRKTECLVRKWKKKHTVTSDLYDIQQRRRNNYIHDKQKYHNTVQHKYNFKGTRAFSRTVNWVTFI